MNTEVLDPVCGMMVNPDTAPAQTTYKNTVYYFCAPGCKVAFEKHPDKYVANAPSQSGQHHHG